MSDMSADFLGVKQVGSISDPFDASIQNDHALQKVVLSDGRQIDIVDFGKKRNSTLDKSNETIAINDVFSEENILLKIKKTWNEASVDGSIVHHVTEDNVLNGREITLEGKKLINFGSCSYLGLEMDSRLIAGSVDAIRRFGTQFSSSKTYVSVGYINNFKI